MRHRPIHEWVSDVAAARPDAIAIQAGDRRRRYGELESDANRLANLLLANGAVKGSIVALVTDDAIAVVTGILGALKAGAIFAPLSPQTPGPRLAVLLAELEPAWIATEGRLLDRVASIEAVGSSPGLVVLDDVPSDPAGPSADRPVHTLSGATSSDVPRNAPTIGPDDMCYVYFTSGSTGTPKGIAGRFKAIDHFIQWEQKTFGIGEGIRVTQLTAPVFDASLRDFFVPLTVGGTVCALPNRDDALDASRLIAWLDATDVNLIHCVPSIFRLMLTERLDGAMFPGLRHILMAGEPLLPADVERWTSVFGDRVQLVNLYGPSETTMIKFFHVVGPSDVRRKSIPIGKPIEGRARDPRR